ncbi:MAG: HNH endonuclease [Chloroflexi bacterium]|nr:HNH endonuclease [Chloroflexota bacterium]
MTRAYVPTTLRQLVTQRAGGHCEYCLYPQSASLLAFEIEHLVSEKHGGATIADNLALACPYCNRFKGTDVGSFDSETGQLTAFFNPRIQDWREHFRLDGALIVPLTPQGRVTVAILQINHPDRVLEREHLIRVGKYP